MSDAPLTDWDMISRWELFHSCAAGEEGQPVVDPEKDAVLNAFADLAGVISASVVLDACCGNGASVLKLTKADINALGCDVSVTAAAHADAYLKRHDCQGGVFQSSFSDLPEKIPHRFDAILCMDLCNEADYKQLQSALSGIFGSLKPGGFLMFSGAPDGSGEEWSKTLMQKHAADDESEAIEWFCRKDKTTCAKIVQGKAEADYIDRRILYAIDEDGNPRLESTTLRIPCYWTWKHWKELCDMTGFCHLETRILKDSEESVNVAWKAGGNLNVIDFESRTRPYLD